MSKILTLSCIVVVVGLALTAGSSAPPIEIRFHVQAPEGTPEKRVVPIAVTNPNEVIKVDKYAFLTEKNVRSVMKLPDGGVLLEMDASGAKVLEAITSENTGRVMVVVCNRRVIYAPLIDVALRQGRMIVPRGINDAEIQSLKKYVAKNKRS
jgi:hypothetical protein